jgi:hypothetical protein
LKTIFRNITVIPVDINGVINQNRKTDAISILNRMVIKRQIKKTTLYAQIETTHTDIALSILVNILSPFLYSYKFLCFCYRAFPQNFPPRTAGLASSFTERSASATPMSWTLKEYLLAVLVTQRIGVVLLALRTERHEAVLSLPPAPLRRSIVT